jgi:hypothetical protein
MYLHPSLALPLAEARAADLQNTAVARAASALRSPRLRVPGFGASVTAHIPRSAR